MVLTTDCTCACAAYELKALKLFIHFNKAVNLRGVGSRMHTVPLLAPAEQYLGARCRPKRWRQWPGSASALPGAPGGDPCSRSPWKHTPAAVSPHWSPHLLPPYAGQSRPGQKPGTEKELIMKSCLHHNRH